MPLWIPCSAYYGLGVSSLTATATSPGESIVSYNHAHGTEYDDTDVDFNL